MPGHSRLGLLAAHLIGLCLQLLLDDLLVNVVRISVTNILHVFILKGGGGEEEEEGENGGGVDSKRLT